MIAFEKILENQLTSRDLSSEIRELCFEKSSCLPQIPCQIERTHALTSGFCLQKLAHTSASCVISLCGLQSEKNHRAREFLPTQLTDKLRFQWTEMILYSTAVHRNGNYLSTRTEGAQRRLHCSCWEQESRWIGFELVAFCPGTKGAPL